MSVISLINLNYKRSRTLQFVVWFAWYSLCSNYPNWRQLHVQLGSTHSWSIHTRCSKTCRCLRPDRMQDSVWIWPSLYCCRLGW